MKLHTNVKVWQNGELRYEGPNFITAAGREHIAKLVNQDSSSVPGYMAIGDGGSATTDATSALDGAEHERVTATVARVLNVLTWTATFGTGIATNKTVREVGIFGAAVAGLLLARIRPADFIIIPSDSIKVEWELRFGDKI